MYLFLRSTYIRYIFFCLINRTFLYINLKQQILLYYVIQVTQAQSVHCMFDVQNLYAVVPNHVNMAYFYMQFYFCISNGIGFFLNHSKDILPNS